MSRLLVQGGTVVTGQGVYSADVLAEDGKIESIGPGLPTAGAQVLDAAGCLVLPGGVDVHVHMPWPAGDFVSTDTIETGTRAAAFGGVTTVLDFVIPGEDQSLAEALAAKLAEAQGCAWVDFGLHLNVRGDVEAKLAEIPGLVAKGFPSFKAFMAYEGFRLADRDLLRLLETAARAGGMVSVHAEDGPLADQTTARLLAQGRRSLGDYALARPAECEVQAVARLLAYQAQTGARVHVHHVSTQGGLELIRRARAEGRPVSGETCPHYLLFTAEDYRSGLAASLVCAPSIKSAADQAALWQGLQSGALSAVATDHCPYSRAQKEASPDDFSGVPGGMAGVETRLPLIFSAGVRKGRLSLERFAAVWAEEPARAFGLYPRKGALQAGSDADLVIFDPRVEWVLQAGRLHQNTDQIPYEGMAVTGKARTVILRGEVLVDGDNLSAALPGGQLVPRWLTDEGNRN